MRDGRNAPNTYDILAYENGDLEHDEIVELFQWLVDSGLAWTLQGHYGRTAERLIASGEVTT